MDNHPIQTNFIITLISLRDWASNSYYYINRRNHLPKKEKSEALSRLCVYESYLKQLIERHSQEEKDSDVQYILKGQSKMNHLARLYEFPSYQLPNSVPLEKAFDLLVTQIQDNSLKGFANEGDQLFLKPIYTLRNLKRFELIVVTFRHNYRHPRCNRVGWFDSLKGNTLSLTYDVGALEKPQSKWSKSLFDVVHLYKVTTVSHNWND